MNHYETILMAEVRVDTQKVLQVLRRVDQSQGGSGEFQGRGYGA